MNINADALDDLVSALHRCFISPNVPDSNLESSNIVDTMDRSARNLKSIAEAITPGDALPYRSAAGIRVSSLTEAAVLVGENLGSIADAINNLAEAVGSLKP